jgi:hypothetical protein
MLDKKNKNKNVSSTYELNNLKFSLLQSMFSGNSQEGADIAYSFSKFLATEKLNSQNYSIFLHLFETGNHWIVDTLINEEDPESIFNAINLNSFIVSQCFTILSKFKPGETYPKLLIVILTIIRNAYKEPASGYKLYRIGCDDLNNICKNFRKDNESNHAVENKLILEILESVINLASALDDKSEKINKIIQYAKSVQEILKNKNKKLDEVIPEHFLIKGDYTRNEFAPSSIGK